MSLEAIEEQALNYLGQVTNPLVRVEVLLAHLRDRGLAETMNAGQLKNFLARHERVRVMEPAVAAPDGAADADGPTGAYVILTTRVPTPEQITAMMIEQLQMLEHALVTARAIALEENDPMRVAPIEEALRRIAVLHKKLILAAGPSQN